MKRNMKEKWFRQSQRPEGQLYVLLIEEELSGRFRIDQATRLGQYPVAGAGAVSNPPPLHRVRRALALELVADREEADQRIDLDAGFAPYGAHG
jgi:hypothetical protein